MMANFGPYFFEMLRRPERVKCWIRAAYGRFGRMQDVAEHLGVSVAQLRIHCRQLEIDPPNEARLVREKAGAPTKRRPRAKEARQRKRLPKGTR